MTIVKSPTSVANIAHYIQLTYGYDKHIAYAEAEKVINKLTSMQNGLFADHWSLEQQQQLKISVFVTDDTTI